MAQPPVTQLQSEIDPESNLYGLLYDSSRVQDWIETFLTIPSEKGRIVPFKLDRYPQQKMMLRNHTMRVITVKGRQTRASSLILGRNMRPMTTKFGLNCFVMTDKERTTAMFRDRVRHHIRDLKRAGFEYDIALDNDQELVIRGLENRFIWASSEERVTGRGYTINIAHLSEAAHFKPETEGEVVGGILPAVPDPPDGWVDIESTPKGAEGLFYDMVQDSQPIVNQSIWNTYLYPWFLEPRYNIDVWSEAIDLPSHYHALAQQLRQDFSPSPDEKQLMDQHGLTVGQILWRRLKMQDMAKTTTPFLQEFVENLETCFIGTGDSFFASEDGTDHLAYHRQNRMEPIEKRDQLPYRDSPVSFHGSNMVIWELPVTGDPYAMYQDTSKGGTSKDSDPSVITVMHAITRHIVARLTVKATPREIAEMGCAIGQFYNHAMYGGERDAWGAHALERVKELSYPNIYYHVDYKADGRTDVQPWIYPTQQARNMMLLKLREWAFDHSLVIKDATLLQEMGAFTYQKSSARDTWKAQGRKLHDDHVLSASGACVVAERVAQTARSRAQAKKDETIVVGRNGIVMRRGTSAPQPWFR